MDPFVSWLPVLMMTVIIALREKRTHHADSPMRVSKEQAAENRQKILDAAARLFRERGFDAVAVADLMSAAGFTHGGFYNHFESKEALEAEACAAALAGSRPPLDDALASHSSKDWNRYARDYASAEHRDHPETGCTLAALATDAGRQGDDVQAAFAEHLEHITASLAAHLANEPGAGTAKKLRQRALRTWSELIGAVILARAVAGADPELSDELLEATRKR
jgi:TetR/AcrR family transcriptional repressor of nem operon